MTGMVFGGGGGGGGSLPPLSNPAAAGDILKNKQSYDSQGNLITGSIVTKAAQTYTPTTSQQVIQGGQYLGGDQIINAVQAQAMIFVPANYQQKRIATPPQYFSEVTVEPIAFRTVQYDHITTGKNMVLDWDDAYNGTGFIPLALYFTRNMWDEVIYTGQMLDGFITRQPGFVRSGYSLAVFKTCGSSYSRIIMATPSDVGLSMSWDTQNNEHYISMGFNSNYFSGGQDVTAYLIGVDTF